MLENKDIYFSYDADSAGRKVGMAVLSDDPEELNRVSDKIQLGNELIRKWAYERGGKQYSSGGDQGVFRIHEAYEKDLEALRADYHYLTDLTVSIGVGYRLSESGQALLMAKLHGKNRIIKYNDKTKKEIAAIQKRVKKGKFKSLEEHKLAEQYMKKTEPLNKALGEQLEPSQVSEKPEEDCQYCDQTDGIDPNHCQYCHDEEPINSEENCQYCDQTNVQTTDDCQYCKDTTEEDCQYCNTENLDFPELAADGEDKTIPPLVSADSNNAQAPAGSEEERALAEDMGMNPPEIGKPPPPAERPPIGQGPTAEVQIQAEDNEEDPNQRFDDQRDVVQIDPEDNHSKEALSSIAEQIESEATPNPTNVDEEGEENISSGDKMEDNVSRPEGFDQTTPGDSGMSGDNQAAPEDEEPDMKSLLEEGLDQHAETANKQKAIQSISQALTQFKAAKQSLEMSREQMPQLYQASIGILKAMIDMAGMLGLGGDVQPTQELGAEQEALLPEQEQAEENEWSEPFPAHPDQGGEAKPQHAPSGSDDGSDDDANAIGQSIKKLPTKNTTAHVAKTPIPVGGVNAKGQQKVMDNQGNIRFISRKQGLVMGDSGVPVKPK